MVKLFRSRQEGVEVNSDAAAGAYREAARAKAAGDTAAVLEWNSRARHFDMVAEDFADGRNDDVVGDR